MSLSPDQIEIRAQGMSATDVAAVVGAHPYRSPLDVWLAKTGRAQPFEGNARTKWGELLEPVIRRDYEERHNVRVEVRGTYERDGWKFATPDGVVFQNGALEADRGMEIKVHGNEIMRFLGYGTPGSDEVPTHELVQSVWCMGVTGLPRWDLVVFAGIPVEYVIDRDEELIGMLSERAERFLVDYVRTDTPPPPDGSPSYDRWIASRFNAENSKGAMIPIPKDDPLLEQIEELRVTRAAIADLAKTKDTLEQAIKIRIGDAAGLTLPGRLKITYKQPKSSVETDWAKISVANQLIAQVAAQATEPSLERALVALDKLADQHFANTRATITGGEIRDAMITMRDALVEIAKSPSIAVNTRTVSNARRLLTPSQWKE